MPQVSQGINTSLSNMTQDVEETCVHPVCQQAARWGSQDGSKSIFKCELFLTAKQLKRKENHAEKEIKESSVQFPNKKC